MMQEYGLSMGIISVKTVKYILIQLKSQMNLADDTIGRHLDTFHLTESPKFLALTNEPHQRGGRKRRRTKKKRPWNKYTRRN